MKFNITVEHGEIIEIWIVHANNEKEAFDKIKKQMTKNQIILRIKKREKK